MTNSLAATWRPKKTRKSHDTLHFSHLPHGTTHCDAEKRCHSSVGGCESMTLRNIHRAIKIRPGPVEMLAWATARRQHTRLLQATSNEDSPCGDARRFELSGLTNDKMT